MDSFTPCQTTRSQTEIRIFSMFSVILFLVPKQFQNQNAWMIGFWWHLLKRTFLEALQLERNQFVWSGVFFVARGVFFSLFLILLCNPLQDKAHKSRHKAWSYYLHHCVMVMSALIGMQNVSPHTQCLSQKPIWFSFKRKKKKKGWKKAFHAQLQKCWMM